MRHSMDFSYKKLYIARARQIRHIAAASCNCQTIQSQEVVGVSGQSHACHGGSSRIFYFKLICCILCVGKALLGWGVRAVNIGLCVRCQSHSKCMYYLPKPPCGLAEPCKMINFCLAAIRKIAITMRVLYLRVI